MDILHQIELAWTLSIQSIGSWAILPMKFFSFFGQEEFFIALMPALYWCVDQGMGLRIGLMLLLSNTLNFYFKILFHLPRPYWIDARVKAYSAETTFGMPSGHAQIAASNWGLAAYLLKKRWVTILCIISIFLIGFSRIYLGMHFTSDVLAGWLLGGVILLAFIKLEKPVSAWIVHLSFVQTALLVLATSILILVGGWVCRLIIANWSVPAQWVNLSVQASGSAPDPIKLDDLFTVAGTWLGFGLGAAWLKTAKRGFNTSGNLRQRVFRYILGIVGLLVIWYGLGLIFPHSGDLANGLRYLRYTLVGLWISALAPLLFVKMKLASPL